MSEQNLQEHSFPEPVSCANFGFVSLSYESEMFNMMRVCDNILFPHHIVSQMCGDQAIRNRSCAVEWMMKVMVDECSEIRDTSVRVFDTYLTISFIENPKVLFDTCYIAFAAAAAIVLSSKLHSSRKSIDASWFTAFNTEDILFFERQILLKAGSRISPLATPAFFLHFLSELFRECGMCRLQEADEISMIATTLVGEFWENPSCLLFAPSTIATTAMIVSISLHHMTCDAFLDRIPDFLYPDRDQYPFFRRDLGPADSKQAYLDFHRCMQAMEMLPTFRAMNHRYGSPTSVAVLGDTEEMAESLTQTNHSNGRQGVERTDKGGRSGDELYGGGKDHAVGHTEKKSLSQSRGQISGTKRLRIDA